MDRAEKTDRKLPKLLHLFGLVTALSLLAACGGGSSSSSPSSGPGIGSYTNASLKGPYVFFLNGSNSAGTLAMAGVFQADGNGNLTSGTLDSNNASSVISSVPFSGSYQVNPDGHGIVTLQVVPNKIRLDFVLTSSQHGLLIRSDSNATGSGTLDQQDTTALNKAAQTGNYVFSFSGNDGTGSQLDEAGAFTADGNGNITAGVKDINDGGSVVASLPMTGTYSVGAKGRGSLIINSASGTLTFATYVISAKQWKAVEIDAAPELSGDVFQQQSTTFSNSSLNGSYVFALAGTNGTGPFAAAGQLSADGNGSITSGIEDVNNAGSVVQGSVLSGNYNVAANGRAVISFSAPSGTVQLAAYPAATGRIVLMEIDNNANAIGVAFPQQISTTANSAIQGPYVLNYNGVLNNGEIDVISKVTADGSGNLSGFEDANFVGSFSSYSNFTGTYTATSNGRFTGTLHNSAGTANVVHYVANNSEVLFVDVDNNQVDIGEMQLQTQP